MAVTTSGVTARGVNARFVAVRDRVVVVRGVVVALPDLIVEVEVRGVDVMALIRGAPASSA